MASNFKILVYRNSDNVHLKLTGDFDGTSADELLNALKENCADVRTVFIHTSGLTEVYPFGQQLLQKSLYIMNGQSTRLVFTGKHGPKIGRKGIDLFEDSHQGAPRPAVFGAGQADSSRKSVEGDIEG